MLPPDYIEMSPTEFEQLVYSYLKEIGSSLDKFEIKHNSKEIGIDGTYQIDVIYKFEATGVIFKVLVECKHHKSPIQRYIVEVLKNRLNSLGAQKGVLFSTSKFQSGCIEYAEKHGIALIRMIEGKYLYETKSLNMQDNNIPDWLPKYFGEYIYNKQDDNYTVYNIQEGWIDGLKEFILKP